MQQIRENAKIYENTLKYMKILRKQLYIYSCRKHMPCMSQARPGEGGGWDGSPGAGPSTRPPQVQAWAWPMQIIFVPA